MDLIFLRYLRVSLLRIVSREKAILEGSKFEIAFHLMSQAYLM